MESQVETLHALLEKFLNTSKRYLKQLKAVRQWNIRHLWRVIQWQWFTARLSKAVRAFKAGEFWPAAQIVDDNPLFSELVSILGCKSDEIKKTQQVLWELAIDESIKGECARVHDLWHHGH